MKTNTPRQRALGAPGTLFCGLLVRNRSVGVKKSLSADISRMGRIGSRFQDDGAQRITAGGCVIVQRAMNDPALGLRFAL